MQLSTLVLCALAVLAAPTLTAAAAEGTARVHVHQTRVHERSVDGAVESRAKMFERIAHMKETPWDSDDAQKAAKCDDFCLLQSFWEFQLARNCVNSLVTRGSSHATCVRQLLRRIRRQCKCSVGLDHWLRPQTSFLLIPIFELYL
jgi:hypothetical protein